MLARLINGVFRRITELSVRDYLPLAPPATLILISPLFPPMRFAVQEDSEVFLSINALALMANLIGTLYLIVILHRTYLLGRRSLPTHGMTVNAGVLVKVAWYYSILTVLMIVLLLLIDAAINLPIETYVSEHYVIPGTILALIPLGVVSRFLLVIPSASIGHSLGMKESWSRTRQSKVTSFVVGFVAFLLLGLILEPIRNTGELRGPLVQSIKIAILILEALLLSEYYRQTQVESTIVEDTCDQGK